MSKNIFGFALDLLDKSEENIRSDFECEIPIKIICLKSDLKKPINIKEKIKKVKPVIKKPKKVSKKKPISWSL